METFEMPPQQQVNSQGVLHPVCKAGCSRQSSRCRTTGRLHIQTRACGRLQLPFSVSGQTVTGYTQSRSNLKHVRINIIAVAEMWTNGAKHWLLLLIQTGPVV